MTTGNIEIPEDGWVEIFAGTGDVTNQAQVEIDDADGRRIEPGDVDEEEEIKVSVLMADGEPTRVSVEPVTYNGTQAQEAVEKTFPGYEISGNWEGDVDCVSSSIVSKGEKESE